MWDKLRPEGARIWTLNASNGVSIRRLLRLEHNFVSATFTLLNPNQRREGRAGGGVILRKMLCTETDLRWP